jgi:hypothetical protein
MATAARLVGALRAGGWAWSSHASARRQLAAGGLDVDLDPPRPLPLSVGAGVYAALRVRRATCLERSFVLQKWLAAHGEPRDVVIGVRAGDGPFRAHAWIDGEAYRNPEPFVEMQRVAPR